MTRTVALDLELQRIHCNTLCPGCEMNTTIEEDLGC